MAMHMTPEGRREARNVVTGAVLAASALLAGGCAGTLEDVIPDEQPSYKSSTSTQPLDLPPDLKSSSMQDTLRIPEVGATYSQYASGEGGAGTQSAATVLPEIDNARIERSGTERWLVVAMKPEEAWSRIRDFWPEQGFVIEIEEPDIGIIETNWAEKHTALPAGLLKQLVLQLGDSLYGVTVRDQYRTRIERGTEAGTVEIYISHRGAEQMVVGDASQGPKREDPGKRVWQPRPSDPGLEAEMLSRLMIFLGTDEERAGALVADAAPETRARLVGGEGSATELALDEDFSRAWRRTGHALDRAGFTVEDRDRSRGLFFVRYVDPGAGPQDGKKGFLSGLQFWKNDDEAEQVADAYLIRLIGEAEATRIVVLDREGNPQQSPAASRILGVLHEQLE